MKSIHNKKINAAKHFPALDALRGAAIFLVICHHVSYSLSEPKLDPFAKFIAAIGWTGVDLFFAISGFLITYILVSKQENIRSFFIKRFFRIFPLYFCAITIYLVVGLSLGREDIGNLWLPLLFLTGWVAPFMDSDQIPYLITWSLSVEESAYIIFGLFSLASRVRYLKMLWSFIFFSFILRWILLEFGVFEVQSVYYFPLTRIDAIAFGGLVAIYSFKFRTSIAHFSLLLTVTIMLLAWLNYSGQYNEQVAIFGYTIFSGVAACWALIMIQVNQIKSIPIKILSYIGRRSYFIYLFHVFVISLLSMPFFTSIQTKLGFWGVVTLTLVVTSIFAEISWRLFESPIINFGRRVAAAK